MVAWLVDFKMLQEGFRKERVVVGFLPGLETTGGKSVQGFSRTENQRQEAQINNLLCAEEMTRVTGWLPITANTAHSDPLI